MSRGYINISTILFVFSQAVEKVAKVGFIAGTIQRDKLNAFERLLFRATRGNLFLRSAEIEELRDPATGEMQKKSVFVVFFAGERSRLKAGKVGDGLNVMSVRVAKTLHARFLTCFKIYSLPTIRYVTRSMPIAILSRMT